jgi:hypothetical protein
MASCSSCLHYLNSPRYLAHRGRGRRCRAAAPAHCTFAGTRHQITQLRTAQLTVIDDTRAKPNGGSRSSPMATTGYRFR